MPFWYIILECPLRVLKKCAIYGNIGKIEDDIKTYNFCRFFLW